MRLAPAILAGALAGCSATAQPGAVQASAFSPEIRGDFRAAVESAVRAEMRSATSQAAGPQTASGGGWNIGTVSVDGSTLVIVVPALAVIVLIAWRLWARGSGYRRAVDVMVRHNLDRGIPQNEADRIQQKALASKAEKWLHARVRRAKRLAKRA